MNTLKIYKNYGCLTAEKRIVYTAYAAENTASYYEEIMVEIPTDWELYKNEAGLELIETPWGQVFTPNELLSGNETPYFSGINKEGQNFKSNLKVIERR